MVDGVVLVRDALGEGKDERLVGTQAGSAIVGTRRPLLGSCAAKDLRITLMDL